MGFWLKMRAIVGTRLAPRRSGAGARLAQVLVLCALGLGALAPAAHAGLSNWTSLSGLTASDNADWVRLYQTGSTPTTIYAGTDGNGVYKTFTDGLSWAPCNTGLPSDFLTVYTIYTSGGKVWMGSDDGLFSSPDTNSASCSWQPVAQGPPADPANPTNLPGPVQAVISLPGGKMLADSGAEDGGPYWSTDGGNTWHPPAANAGMPADASIWSFANFANFVWAATTDGVYRSSDFGSTWTLSSDGLPFDNVFKVFPDTQNPLIYYAETGSSGLYRSIDGGTTWQPVNGDPGGEQLGNGSYPIIRAIQEFSGSSQTRLYVATSDGLWAGTLPNVIVPGTGGKSAEVPGQISWRQVTQDGLGNNVIMWALSSFTNVPGTLLAGTQSNGGYSLTFQPPVNDGQPQDLPSWLAASIIQLTVGTQLVGTPGSWSGTPQIDYSYQWQRCTSTQTSSCSDISGATDKIYTVGAADQGDYIRNVVTASNDFPSFSPINKADSVIRGPVGAAPGPLPGANQESGPTIIDTTPQPDDEPTQGDTLSAPPSSENPSGWLLNPAPLNVSYQWERCDIDGNNCADIPGARASTYVPTAADVEQELRVVVTGSNDNGATTLPVSGPSDPIIPLPAQEITAPALAGNAIVGSNLVGSVGTWVSPATTWSRQWLQCQPDGTDCAAISGATSPDYTIQAGDYGMRLEEEVTAAVVPSGFLPLPVVVDTQPSAVVTYPPGVTPPPTPPGSTPAPIKSPLPPAKAPPLPLPSLSGLTLGHKGAKTLLGFKLSQAASVTILLERAVAGHRSHGKCVARHVKHKPSCTLDTTVLKLVTRSAGPGKSSVVIPTSVRGRKLRPGRYLLAVTPVNPNGQRGATRSIGVTLARK